MWSQDFDQIEDACCDQNYTLGSFYEFDPTSQVTFVKESTVSIEEPRRCICNLNYRI